MPADLHIHSNLSDGTESPEEIVRQAKYAGLTVISITDHDNVDGIERAITSGFNQGVEVIPGVEFTCEFKRWEIHILGYFIDHKSQELLGILEKVQKSRHERIIKMIKKLKKMGVEIEAEDVFKISGKKSPGRPHVARVLVERGFVSNFKEAFVRYLAFKGPAYVSHYKLSPFDAIGLVKRAAGIAVFAHPAVSKCDELIPDMVSAGLSGIEAEYFGQNREKTRHYLSLAEKFGLLVTGGSDYHGGNTGKEVKLGDFKLKDEYVEKLKNEHLRRN